MHKKKLLIGMGSVESSLLEPGSSHIRSKQPIPVLSHISMRV